MFTNFGNITDITKQNKMRDLGLAMMENVRMSAGTRQVHRGFNAQVASHPGSAGLTNDRERSSGNGRKTKRNMA